MEKRSSINDVHKVNPKDFVELHKTLEKKLGENNPFAKFSIGGGFYLWSDNRHEWTQMINASSLEQSIVMQELIECKKNITSIIGTKAAEILFTYPDDSYIYFSNEGNQIKILITGWGFKKPVRVTGKNDVTKLKQDNPITISFLDNGIAQSDYEFGIQLPVQLKKFKTDHYGKFIFSDLKVNEKIQLVNLENDQRFELTIEENQSHYDFDITKYVGLRIHAMYGDSPLGNEPVNVSYGDKAFDLSTSSNGDVSIKLPFSKDIVISARIQEQLQEEVISPEGNNLEFFFEKPVEKVQTDVVVSIMKDNTPQANSEVTINYGEEKNVGYSDDLGIYRYHCEVVPETTCTVEIQGYKPQSKRLKEVPENIFEFTTNTPLPVSKPTVHPDLVVKSTDGTSKTNYPVTISYNSEEITTSSDENGIIRLPEIEVGTKMTVTDGNNPVNVKQYEIKASVDEYTFIIPEDETIEIIVLDYKGRPFHGKSIHINQEGGKEINEILDKDGRILLDRADFETGEELNVHIESSRKNYEPFSFKLEEDTFQYILQENKVKKTWWISLLEILLILLVIIGLLLLWPVWEELFYRLAELIY